jgi:hypothetical protein
VLPGVRVRVEHLKEDPFLIAEWRRGIFKERVCIGYWGAPGFEEHLAKHQRI